MNTQTHRAESRATEGGLKSQEYTVSKARALQVLTYLLLGPTAGQPSWNHWLSPHSGSLPPAHHPSAKQHSFLLCSLPLPFCQPCRQGPSPDHSQKMAVCLDPSIVFTAVKVI